MTNLTVEERFWSKVDLNGEGGCWLWTAAKNSSGYGVFWRNGDLLRAHRVSWEWLRGLIPEGLQPDHLCRVRHCVNPDHLELVTSRENTLRGVGATALNAVKTECPQGHPYSGDNLKVRSDGSRRCRTCDREEHRARYAAKKGK